MHKKFTFVLILLVMMATLISACGGGAAEPESTLDAVPAPYAGKTNPFAGSSDAVAAGKADFDINCASCHGETGLGDGPASAALTPQPASLADLNQAASDDYFFWRISEGKEGTAMVAWKTVLSEDQIWQVVTYLRTFE